MGLVKAGGGKLNPISDSKVTSGGWRPGANSNGVELEDVSVGACGSGI